MRRRDQIKRAEKQLRRQERAVAKSKRSRPALEALSLPEDLTGSSVRITALGNRRLLIENHRGIVRMEPACVKIMTSQGIVTIAGEELYISDVRSDSMAVVGSVSSIGFPGSAAKAGDPDA